MRDFRCLASQDLSAAFDKFTAAIRLCSSTAVYHSNRCCCGSQAATARDCAARCQVWIMSDSMEACVWTADAHQNWHSEDFLDAFTSHPPLPPPIPPPISQTPVHGQFVTPASCSVHTCNWCTNSSCLECFPAPSVVSIIVSMQLGKGSCQSLTAEGPDNLRNLDFELLLPIVQSAFALVQGSYSPR